MGQILKIVKKNSLDVGLSNLNDHAPKIVKSKWTCTKESKKIVLDLGSQI